MEPSKRVFPNRVLYPFLSHLTGITYKGSVLNGANNESLAVNEALRSPNGLYSLVLRPDASLVMYKVVQGLDAWEAQFSSNTAGAADVGEQLTAVMTVSAGAHM